MNQRWSQNILERNSPCSIYAHKPAEAQYLTISSLPPLPLNPSCLCACVRLSTYMCVGGVGVTGRGWVSYWLICYVLWAEARTERLCTLEIVVAFHFFQLCSYIESGPVFTVTWLTFTTWFHKHEIEPKYVYIPLEMLSGTYQSRKWVKMAISHVYITRWAWYFLKVGECITRREISTLNTDTL